MLNLLRSKTFVKTVLWIVVLGFVGWLGYDVGYGGPSRDQDFYVGEINGTQLDYPTYQERRNLELQRRRDPENPDALDEFAIDQDIWDRQVEEILMKEAIDDYGIQVSSQEVAIAFLEQPLPGLETADIFQTDGAFDASKYREWYKNLDQAEFYRLTSQTYGRGMTLSEYESLISQQLSQNKLRQRITSAAVVGNADVRRQYAQNNERVKVEAAYVTLSKVLDDTVAITNEEIRGYYEANLDDYAQESRASLAYAALSKAPTTRDVARIKHDVDYVLAQLRDGADFGDLARAYSDHTATRGDGGFLGEMTEGALPSEQDKAVFALKAGEFTEALETPDGWEIYKVDSLSGIGGVDTALVRHILFRTDVAGPATLDSLRANADSLFNSGARFDKVAQGMGVKVDTTFPFGVDESFPFRRLSSRISAKRLAFFAHNHDIGEIAPTYETKNHIIVARVATSRPRGHQPLEDVRRSIERVLKNDKKLEMAAEMLEPVSKRVAAGDSLSVAANAAGIELATTEPFTRNEGARAIKTGARNEFTGAAFALQQPGQISGVVKVKNRGAYILQLISREFDDTGLTASESLRIKGQLIRQLNQSLWQHWLDNAKATAEIVDRRALFYGY